MDPKYPIYVISKGRWQNPLTAKALCSLGVPFAVVVEPQEAKEYRTALSAAVVVHELPFSNLGQGSIPARNWVWEHAKAAGHFRHWILDDNLRRFYRIHKNRKYVLRDGTGFRVIEDWSDRYENVALAGMQYELLAPAKNKMPPMVFNTRAYSCILICNSLGHRWRGRYNEDTDLSLRVLKDRWCSALFNVFVADKVATMTMKGGNTDELYRQDAKVDGRLLMAESLQQQHPDVVKVVRKWGRWQHQVDYRRFKRNKLIRKPGVVIPDGPNEYGMVLRHKGSPALSQ